jgi:prevent-host-death family protein
VEIGSFDAKNQLSALLDRVEKGEEIVITRRGRAIARLAPYHDPGREKAKAAAESLRTRARAHGGHFDWEEWKKYRDEGRE